MTRPPVAPDLDQATRRALAVGLFNHTWTLLENPNRTPEQDDEMLHAAHASRYHWGEVGEPVNLARGEWQVLARLRRPRPRRAGALPRPTLRRDQRGERRRPRGLGPRLGVRGDGPGAAPSPATRRRATSGRRGAVADLAEDRATPRTAEAARRTIADHRRPWHRAARRGTRHAAATRRPVTFRPPAQT